MRRALLHFLLLGLVIWAAEAWWQQRHRGTVTITAGDVAQLRSGLAQELRRAPEPRQLEAGLRQRIDEEVMLREALRQDLDRKDPQARERLLKNIRFAFPHSEAGPEALLALARELDMPRRDAVVRRRLLQLIERRLVGPVPVRDAALRAYWQAHADRYRRGERLTLEHRYFRAGRSDPAGDARAALETLGAQPDRADLGDPFAHGHRFEAVTPGQLERLFGASLAAAAREADAGWVGPVASVYGQHLLRVQRQSLPEDQDFARLRPKLVAALEPELRRRALDAALARLRARYRIEVAGR